MATVCKNCNHPTEHNFCAYCGQKTSTTRFNQKQLIHDFIHGFFHVDHGIFFTAWELLINPGRMLNNYLKGKRINYFNPFSFLLIVGGIGAFLLPRLRWTSFFVDLGIITRKSVDQHVWNSSLRNFTLRLLVCIPVYALITRLFYFKRDYNYAEHLIAQTYIRAEISIFLILLSPLQLLIHADIWAIPLKLLYLIINLIYVAWAFAGLFDGRITILRYLKAVFITCFALVLELISVNWFITKNLVF